jgi:hypothetical protein
LTAPRVHHLSSAEIGTYAGTFKGPFGMAGTLVGGLVAAQISRRDHRWKLWAPVITSGLAGPVFAECMLTSDFATMVAALALTPFLVGFHLGPIFAIAQTLARPSMRALARSRLHDAVRYSLLSAAVTTTVGALLFVWAARSIRADIERAI